MGGSELETMLVEMKIPRIVFLLTFIAGVSPVGAGAMAGIGRRALSSVFASRQTNR